jgi:hypothetical protein
VEVQLHPLTTAELPELDLTRALNVGMLPAHYLAEDPKPLLQAYVNAYVKEEIIDESLTRNIPAFSRFLQVVGLTHGRQLNYLNEVRAYLAYRRIDLPLSFWRTSSGLEVDLILGAVAVAIEFKASREVRGGDMKGLLALREEHPGGRCLLVSREDRPRIVEGIELLPWREFCRQLWAGEIAR